MFGQTAKIHILVVLLLAPLLAIIGNGIKLLSNGLQFQSGLVSLTSTILANICGQTAKLLIFLMAAHRRCLIKER